MCERGGHTYTMSSLSTGLSGLSAEEFESVLEGARTVAMSGRGLTAGYGGMDVVEAAYAAAGVDSEFGTLDLTIEQVREVQDVYHSIVPRQS
jgi:hypothetical protein